MPHPLHRAMQAVEFGPAVTRCSLALLERKVSNGASPARAPLTPDATPDVDEGRRWERSSSSPEEKAHAVLAEVEHAGKHDSDRFAWALRVARSRTYPELCPTAGQPEESIHGRLKFRVPGTGKMEVAVRFELRREARARLTDGIVLEAFRFR